jgi:uncharacterized protein with GYD domain
MRQNWGAHVAGRRGYHCAGGRRFRGQRRHGRSTVPLPKEGKTMPTFVTLSNFTEQGVKNVKDSVKRADAVKEAAKKKGITLKDIYWTMGAHDVVGIWEAPDGPTMSAFVLSVAAAGNISGMTLRAYDRDEMTGILKKMG